MGMGGKAGEQFTDINVTPLTDVFLVLLVIMILVAPLVNMSVLKVDPPAPPNPNAKPPEPEKIKLDVKVTKEGTVLVNGNQINPPDTVTIQKAFQAEQQKEGTQDIPLNLTSDADALQKHVVAVMDAASGAGIKRMRILPLVK